MVDYNMLSTITQETTDPHLPPLKKIGGYSMNKYLTKSYTPTKLYGVFIVRVATMLSLSVCDMNFQSFRGFDYSPLSSLRQWPGGTFVRFRFSQGGFGHCFCRCDWLLRGLLFALWIDSTVAGLTAVWGWMKRGFGAAVFSWTPFLQIVVPWEVQVVLDFPLFCFHIPDIPDLQVPMVWRFHRDMNDRGIIFEFCIWQKWV